MVSKKERRAYHKKYYREHREEIVESQRKRRRENTNGIREREKQYYQDNKEKYRKYRKEKFVIISTFGMNKIKGQKKECFVDGMKKHITKNMVRQIKNKVLEDCQKNPGKYLE